MGGKDEKIVAYGRENNSGTYSFFKEHVLSNEDFAREVQTLPGTGGDGECRIEGSGIDRLWRHRLCIRHPCSTGQAR